MGRTLKINLPGWVQSLLIFLLGMACFVFVLVNRQPIPLRPMALQVRYGFTLFAPIALLVFYLIFSIKGFAGRLLSFVAILSLFALGLSGLWASGQTEPQVIGGLLPTTDAGEYYFNALRFLNGSNFSDYASRRPLFSSFFSTLLWITDKNLQATLALMVLLTAISAYFATNRILKSFDSTVAALFLVLVFLFYRRFSGLVMSENYGLVLGLMGFSLLIQGLLNKQITPYLISLFLFSFGMNVRAGPFFVLPFLILGSLLFSVSKENEWKVVLLACISVILGFLINWIVFRVLGSPTGALFSNFSHTLYGLSKGGMGWSQIWLDHPELKLLTEGEMSRKIFELAITSIFSNPLAFITGCIKEIVKLFNFVNSNVSIFSFASGENQVINTISQLGLYVLSLTGIVNLWKGRSKLFNKSILLSIIGIVISAPFITSDASNMRAYATVIPFLLFIPAIGFSQLIQILPIRLQTKEKSETKEGIQISASLILVLISLIPLIIRGINHQIILSKNKCETEQVMVIAEIKNGSSINIFPDSDFFLDWMPNFHSSRFKTSYFSYSLEQMREEIRKLPSKSQIIATINMIDGRDMYLLIENHNFINRPGKYAICGKWSEFPRQEYVAPYFYAHDLLLISQ